MQLKLAQKVILTNIIILVSVILIGAFSYTAFLQTKHTTTELIEVHIPGMNAVSSVESQVSMAMHSSLKYLTQNTAEEYNSTLTQLETADQILSKILELATAINFRPMIDLSTNNKKLISDYKKEFLEISASMKKGESLSSLHDKIDNMSGVGNRIVKSLQQATALGWKAIEGSAQDSRGIATSSFYWTVGLIIFSLLIIIFSGTWLLLSFKNILKTLLSRSADLVSRVKKGQIKNNNDEKIDPHFEFKEVITGFNDVVHEISQPLYQSKIIFDKIAVGDLSQKMHGHYEGEILELKNSINASIDSMVALIQGVKNTSESVNTGAG